MTNELKIADEDQGIEGCLVPLKEELQKEITKTQREANHRSLLTKSDLVIQSSEDLGQTTLVEPAGDNQPSRQPPWASPTDKNEMDWVWTWSRDDMIRLQEDEPAIMSVLQWKLDGVKKPLWKEVSQESGDLKALWGLWKSLEVKDGLLYRRFVPEMAVKEQENPCVIFQVVAPKAIRQNILRMVHSHKTTDHLEVREMLHSVRQSFYWPGYREDIRRWFRQCRV